MSKDVMTPVSVGRKADKRKAQELENRLIWLDSPESQPDGTVEGLPRLRLNLYVVGKLNWLLARSDDEVGGFLVAGGPDPLAITDFVLVKQTVSHASFSFDDDGLSDYYTDMAESGLQIWQCAHIYAHTHPVMTAAPSGLDDDVFVEKFCNRDVPGCCLPWAGQFIRSRTGESFFKMAFNPENGPTVQVVCPVVVDPGLPFRSSDEEAWEAEFVAKVKSYAWFPQSKSYGRGAAMPPLPHRNPEDEISKSFGHGVGSGDSGLVDPNPNQDFLPEHDRRVLPASYLPDYNPAMDHRLAIDDSPNEVGPDDPRRRRKVLEDPDNPPEYAIP